MSLLSPTSRLTPSRRRGQGNAEFILIVVLLAGGVFGTAAVFGEQQRELYAVSATELAGEDSAVDAIECPDGMCRIPFGNCFVAGTKVMTVNGPRNIEEVRRGDLVYSRNPDTGETALKPVAERFVTPNREVMSLELSSPTDGHTESLVVTPNHPFWAAEQGWVDASELREGDLVTTLHGFLRVQRSKTQTTGKTVYNFEVADWHTYFVGQSGVWVHNMNRNKRQCVRGNPPAASTGDGNSSDSESDSDSDSDSESSDDSDPSWEPDSARPPKICADLPGSPADLQLTPATQQELNDLADTRAQATEKKEKIRHSEQAGELAAKAFTASRPNAGTCYSCSNSGVFDRVCVSADGSTATLVEAKGGSSTLGARQFNTNGDRAQQGTDTYRKSILASMSGSRASQCKDDSGTPISNSALATKLKGAANTDYFLVKQDFEADGRPKTPTVQEFGKEKPCPP